MLSLVRFIRAPHGWGLKHVFLKVVKISGRFLFSDCREFCLYFSFINIIFFILWKQPPKINPGGKSLVGGGMHLPNCPPPAKFLTTPPVVSRQCWSKENQNYSRIFNDNFIIFNQKFCWEGDGWLGGAVLHTLLENV